MAERRGPGPLVVVMEQPARPEPVAAPLTEQRLEEVRPRLVRIALALGVAVDDVPDIVQETLIAGYQRRSRFDAARGTVEAWLTAILVNQARNRARGRRRWQNLLGRLGRASGPQSTRAAEVALEARLTLEKLLAGLAPQQRDVVALYEIGDFDSREAGRILGITPEGVRSIARDARKRLNELAGGVSRGKEAHR